MAWTFYNSSGEEMINTIGDGVVAAAASITNDLTLTGGNVVVVTPGKGIDFSAQTGTATLAGTGTTSGEVLNHYEEGTFTPSIATYNETLTDSGGSIAVGRYTRIGDVVLFQIGVSTSNTTGLTGSSATHVRGLPFVTTDVGGNAQGNAHSGNGYGLNITAGTTVAGNVPAGLSYLALMVWEHASGSQNGLSITQWSSNGNMRLSGHYYIA